MNAPAMTHQEVRALLPHRYPFLLIDTVLRIDLDAQELTAVKNVTANEPFFEGHFPEYPVMPGVLIIEAMAQAAGLLFFHLKPETRGWDVLLVGADKVRFRRPVVPGDVLTLTATVLHGTVITRPWRFAVKATVDGDCAAEGEMLALVVEPARRQET